MPQTQSKNASMTQAVNYKKDSDTPDDDPGLITNNLGLLMNMQRRSSQKKKRKRNRKRKRSSGHSDYPHCSIITPTQRCLNNKARPKEKGKAPSSTSAADKATLNLDFDDEEIVVTNITETHVETIENTVGTFFKGLDSDGDKLESKFNTNPSPPKPVETRGNDLCTILSDSEDKKEKPSTSDNTIRVFSEPSTSGLSNCISSGLKLFSEGLNKIKRNLLKKMVPPVQFASKLWPAQGRVWRHFVATRFTNHVFHRWQKLRKNVRHAERALPKQSINQSYSYCYTSLRVAGILEITSMRTQCVTTQNTTISRRAD